MEEGRRYVVVQDIGVGLGIPLELERRTRNVNRIVGIQAEGISKGRHKGRVSLLLIKPSGKVNRKGITSVTRTVHAHWERTEGCAVRTKVGRTQWKLRCWPRLGGEEALVGIRPGKQHCWGCQLCHRSPDEGGGAGRVAAGEVEQRIKG